MSELTQHISYIKQPGHLSNFHLNIDNFDYFDSFANPTTSSSPLHHFQVNVLLELHLKLKIDL